MRWRKGWVGGDGGRDAGEGCEGGSYAWPRSGISEVVGVVTVYPTSHPEAQTCLVTWAQQMPSTRELICVLQVLVALCRVFAFLEWPFLRHKR